MMRLRLQSRQGSFLKAEIFRDGVKDVGGIILLLIFVVNLEWILKTQNRYVSVKSNYVEIFPPIVSGGVYISNKL